MRQLAATAQSARQAVLLELKKQTPCRIKSSERGNGRYLPVCRMALGGETADTHLSKSAVPLYDFSGRERTLRRHQQ